MNSKTEDLIRQYCVRHGISREQFEAEGLLTQETIDALVELHNSGDDDPVIPPGLPGSGKRRSALTDDERELLSANESELDQLLKGGADQ
jgi:hypothetical protein